MALITFDVKGPVLLPDGTVPTYGSIVFELLQWSIDSGKILVSHGPIRRVLDKDGDFTAPLWVESADQFHCIYRVTLEYYDNTTGLNTQIQEELGYIELSQDSSTNLSDLLEIGIYSTIDLDIISEALNAAASAYESAAAAALSESNTQTALSDVLSRLDVIEAALGITSSDS